MTTARFGPSQTDGSADDRHGEAENTPATTATGQALLAALAWPAWYLLSLGNPALVVVVVVLLGAQCAMLPELTFGTDRAVYRREFVSRSLSVFYRSMTSVHPGWRVECDR